jgi:mRNA interferase MazF
MNRGDVALVHYPFSSGVGGLQRPALIVQSDGYNQRLANTIIVQITTNLRAAADPCHFLIEAATPEGQRFGLLHDSLISCINIATIDSSRIDRVIGSLTDASMLRIDQCLRTSLGI